MNSKVNPKWLYFPVILLFLNFFYRLFYDQAKMLKYFPVDYNTDGASYMAQLFFMKACGFHQTCYYWYNGFTNFLHSPPGWYLFTLPIFNIFKVVNVATYISMVLIFIISFFIIYFLYDKIGLTKIERIALFIFFFGNAIAVGNFIKLIRVHELFAWMNFLVFFFIIYYFKDKKFDWRYWFVIPFYAFTLLAYQSVGVISSLLFLSLFLIKPPTEKIYVVLSAFSSLLLSAFWWLPFVLRLNEGGILSMKQAAWVWTFNDLHFYTNIFIFIIPLLLCLIFYFYYKSHRNNIFFYFPILLLAILFFFRLHPFIPVFGNIFPDPYLVFFIFFIVFLFFKLDYSKFNFFKFIPYFLMFLVLLSIGFNIFRTPFFVEPTYLNYDLEIALSNLNGSFLMFGDFGPKISLKNVYSYAPIKYNLSTPYGWYPEVKPQSYFYGLQDLDFYFNDNNCTGFLSMLKVYNITNIISLNENCNFFKLCNFKKVIKENSICSFTTDVS